jgi:hypothetical protein
MQAIKKNYIVDEQNRKIGVQIDIATYKRLEEILENYALVKLMKENEGEEVLEIQKAKDYYKQLGRSN